MKRRSGKLDPSILSDAVLRRLGKPNSRVLVGPRIGEDAAIIRSNGKLLVIHSDPVTGTSRDLGWLAVHVSVNDVVSKGADPRWVSLVLLLDSRTTLRMIRRISIEAHRACLEVGASIVGGHTEVTDTVRRPVVVSTVVGEARAGRYFTSAGAKVGDHIIMTKTAALEGTAILARTLSKKLSGLGEGIIEGASNFLSNISVYPEARMARESMGVTAMHDVTEGGVLCAVQEIALASRLGFTLNASKVPIAFETQRICSTLRLDPLRTIGSGSLLVTVHASEADSLTTRLENDGIQASDIGKITGKGQIVLTSDGTLKVPSFVREEIWRVLP